MAEMTPTTVFDSITKMESLSIDLDVVFIILYLIESLNVIPAQFLLFRYYYTA